MTVRKVEVFGAGGGLSPDGWSSVKRFLLVKVVAADGLAGWGEAYVLTGRERAVAEMIRSLGEAILGMVASPRAFRAHAITELGSKNGGIDYYAAVSAIELALWDITGKRCNAPLHQLLGGALRERIPLYANIYSDRAPDAEAMAERARAMVAAGFRAVKIYPEPEKGLDIAEDRLAKVRAAVGREVDIMIDLYVLDDPYLALQAARRFAPYAPFWFEEPISARNLDALRDIRQRSGLRIVTGEQLSGKARFREVLQRGAADVLNPDVAGCGGLLEFLEIAAMAEAFSVGVSPHSYNSLTVATAVMLHASAVIPNLVWGEHYPDFEAASAAMADTSWQIVEGAASLPNTPGLGVRMNEDGLQFISSTQRVP